MLTRYALFVGIILSLSGLLAACATPAAPTPAPAIAALPNQPTPAASATPSPAPSPTAAPTAIPPATPTEAPTPTPPATATPASSPTTVPTEAPKATAAKEAKTLPLDKNTAKVGDIKDANGGDRGAIMFGRSEKSGLFVFLVINRANNRNVLAGRPNLVFSETGSGNLTTEAGPFTLEVLVNPDGSMAGTIVDKVDNFKTLQISIAAQSRSITDAAIRTRFEGLNLGQGVIVTKESMVKQLESYGINIEP